MITIDLEKKMVAPSVMSPLKHCGKPIDYHGKKWSRSVTAPDGSIYLDRQGSGGYRYSSDRLEPCDVRGLFENSRPDRGCPEFAYYWDAELLLVIEGLSCRQSARRGDYRLTLRRAEAHPRNALETCTPMEAVLHVPEAGNQISTTDGGWQGLFFYGARNIVRLPDGALLASMQGCFETDRIAPGDAQSKRETVYKLRTFVVRSEDGGRSWRYLSTVAAPVSEDPVGEGFDEPALCMLESGELLCVMRTGHYSPLYCSWSRDEGKHWTDPVYTGFERGCAPCLLRLRDGRVALVYGQRFPVGVSLPRCEPRWSWPGCGLVRLAVSEDGRGRQWTDTVIGTHMGSCYATIHEPEPKRLVCQTDGWYWKLDVT